MFNWFLKLFNFVGAKTTTAKQSTVLQKKTAGTLSQQTHSSDYMEAVDELQSKIHSLPAEMQEKCDYAGNIITTSDINSDENLLKVHELGYTRSEFVPLILSRLNNVSLARRGDNAALDKIVSLHLGDSDTLVDDAIEAMVWDFMAKFDISAMPRVRFVLEAKANEDVSFSQDSTTELPDDVVALLKASRDYADPKWNKQTLSALYTADEAASDDRIKSIMHKDPAEWRPFVSALRSRVNKIRDAQKTISKYNSTELKEQIAEQLKASFLANFPKLNTLDNAVHNLGPALAEDSSMGDTGKGGGVPHAEEDEAEDGDLENRIADKTDPGVAAEFDKKRKVLKKRDAAFRALERAAGKDRKKLAAIKVLENSLRDTIGLEAGDPIMTRHLNQYRTKLQLLKDAGYTVLDGEDIKAIYKHTFDKTTVKDPNNANGTLTLGEVRADKTALSLAIDALGIRKGQKYDNTLAKLVSWTSQSNPKYKELSEKRNEVEKRIKDISTEMEKLTKEHLPGSTEKLLQLQDEISSLEATRGELTDYIIRIETSQRLEPIAEMIKTLTKGHGGIGEGTAKDAAVLREYLQKLEKKYDKVLKDAAKNANAEAQQEATKAIINNENALRAGAAQVTDSNGVPLSADKEFMYTLACNFADQKRSMLSSINTNYFEDYLRDTGTKVVKRRNKTSPSANKLSDAQVNMLLKHQNDSDMAGFTLWYLAKHFQETGFNWDMMEAATAALGQAATEESVKAFLTSLKDAPAELFSRIVDDPKVSNFVKQLIVRSPSDRKEYMEDTGKDVSYSPNFSNKNASSFLNSVIEENVLRPFSDDFYGDISMLDRKTEQVRNTIKHYDAIFNKCAALFSRKDGSVAEHEYNGAVDTLKALQQTLTSFEETILAPYDEAILRVVEEANNNKDDFDRYSDARESVLAAREVYKELENLITTVNNYDQTKEWDTFKDVKDQVTEEEGKDLDPFSVTPEGTPSDDKLVHAFPNLTLYKDGTRYLRTRRYKGQYVPTSTVYTGPVITEPIIWAIPSVEGAKGYAVSDGSKSQWHSFDPNDPFKLGKEIGEPAAKEQVTDREQFDQLDSYLPSDLRLKPAEPKEENTEEPEKPLEISDEEPLIDPKEAPRSTQRILEGGDADTKTTAGFNFIGFHKTAEVVPMFKFAATDGIDAFTSPEDIQKEIENPFGTAMTPSETAIKKQREISPDNTSNMGQTSIQQDKEADKSFSSKQITKALKAAYDKDPKLFEQLVKIIANTGSTGTFCSAIVALLPKVNWVNEAAIREYNSTAVEPVHRNSFQHALEKAMEEQLKKNPEFVKICESILKGKPA